jgi:hypothetical protein
VDEDLQKEKIDGISRSMFGQPALPSVLRKPKRLKHSFLKPQLRLGWREQIRLEEEALKFRFPVLYAEDRMDAFGKKIILAVQRVKFIGMTEVGCVFLGGGGLFNLAE